MDGMRNVKIVVVGDGGVGKTCLLISYTSNSFPSEYVPTVFDDYSANIKVGDEIVSIGLWDTAGQEDYDRLRPLSYPGTDIFLLCFSVTSRTSMENIESKWMPEIKHYVHDAQYFVVGTKSDLREDTAKIVAENLSPIPEDECKSIASKIGTKYFEVSALKQTNLNTLFSKAIIAVLKKQSSDNNGNVDKTSGLPSKIRKCYLI